MEKAESLKRVWKYLKPTLQSMSCLQRIRAKVSTFLQERGVEHRALENPHLTLAYLTGVTQDQVSQLFIANEGRQKGRADSLLQENSLLEKKLEIGFSQLKVWRSFVDNQVYLVLVQEQENYELRVKMMNSQTEPHISLFSLGEMTEEDYFSFEKEVFPQLKKKIGSYLQRGQIQIDLAKEYLDIKDL
ncbi:MAG: hypothetical protein HG424_003505 [candidate division SR1 bacterium]|nr:hypothetical protein [candidate division SR1 bacterium]